MSKENVEIISQIKIDRAYASKQLEESIESDLKDSKVENESELQNLLAKVILGKVSIKVSEGN